MGRGYPLDRALRRFVAEEVIDERGRVVSYDEQAAVPIGDKALIYLVGEHLP